jgi:hypothetical protein
VAWVWSMRRHTRARLRADELVRTRQRIHAGRMLSELPQGAPDLRPEEARAAKAMAELVVRRVLDWLTRYPQGPDPQTPKPPAFAGVRGWRRRELNPFALQGETLCETRL